MSDSFMPKGSSVSRERYVIDAKNLPLGRVAAQVASILRGKEKPIFVPHVDCGDFVTVINCDNVILTGKKLENKKRYKYTGYIGHLKTINYSDIMSKNPCKVFEWAIRGMLPSNTLGRKQMKRLNLCVGSEFKDSEKFKPWNRFRKVRVA